MFTPIIIKLMQSLNQVWRLLLRWRGHRPDTIHKLIVMYVAYANVSGAKWFIYPNDHCYFFQTLIKNIATN